MSITKDTKMTDQPQEQALPKFCYSLDHEHYYGDFNSREDALAEASSETIESVEAEEGDTCTVWTAEVKPAIEFLRPWIDNVVVHLEEMLDEIAFDHIGVEDTIVELTPEKRTELGNLILDFLEKNNGFHAWGTTNDKEHKVTYEAPC